MSEAVNNTEQHNVYNPEAYMLLVAFGGQLEPKINRELMANGIHVQRLEIKGGEVPDLGDFDLDNCKGVIFSGGNDSVYGEDARQLPPELMAKTDIPKLGICYGSQALAHELGGAVDTGKAGEYGVTKVRLGRSALFDFGDYEIDAMMNHTDVVMRVPEGHRVIAESAAGIAGFTNDHDIYTVQFHPESSGTEYGTDLLLNFATKICGLAPEPDFSEDTFRDRAVEQQTLDIQNRLGHQRTRAIILDSGGVDSATAHVLAHEALKSIGREHVLSGIYVDTGMMRHEDGDTVKILNAKGYPVESQDWSQFFLHEPVPLPESVANERGYSHLPPMDQVTDPKTMRQIVKYGFVEVGRRLGIDLRRQFAAAEVIALIQGTNLADKIESGDFSGDQIKEHHNSGIEDFVDELIEPLSSLFKGDIRKIAVKLGLPPEIAYRQPFPGPGLCLRIPTNPTGETIWPEDIDAKRTQLEQICQRVGGGAMSGCWLPVEATGQKGDVRVQGSMTLISGKYDPELIEKLAFDIPAATGAARVLYTSGEVDPDSIRGVRQMVNQESLAGLRDAEEAKRQIIDDMAWGGELSQHYVASLPVNLRGGYIPTLMTRMFRTGVRSGLEDYITGEAALGGLNVDESKFRRTLNNIAAAAEHYGFEDSLYDATNKPPGTVELA